MKHLKRFQTQNQFDDFLNSDDYVRPNVSYVNEVDHIIKGMPKPIPPLKFTAVQANSTIKLTRQGSDTTNLPNAVLEYSTDGVAWNSYALDTTITLTNIGDFVMFKGNNARLGYDYDNYHNFVMTGKIAASGYISSLTSPDEPDKALVNNCYESMFDECTSLTTAPALPATTLAQECYAYMFYGCTSLTAAPVLPATTLADNCYEGMFYACTSLTAAPVLPATTLAYWCYYCMFQDCTSLTSAHVLPATTLVEDCYTNMFYGCTSLTIAPALPATTLAYDCYCGMFYNCTSLTTAPELPATTLAECCYDSMFYGCTSLTTAPELPATTLVTCCYRYMFYGCTNLNYVKAMFTTTPGLSYTGNWLSDVAASGIFVKNLFASWKNTGASGVPSGWTVQNAA